MSKTLWTPRPVDDERARVVTPQLRQWFVEFADFLKAHTLVMHCGLCHVDVKARDGWRHWGECVGYRPPPGATPSFGIPPKREELRAAQIEWIRQFQDVGARFLLGLHCAKCDADVSGVNADSDPVYRAACRCREFVGENRDHVAYVPPDATVN